jgi:hypothetical protein
MDGFGKISRAADCILFTTGLCFASHTTYLTVDAAEAPSAPCTNPREVSIEAWVGETTHGVPVTLKNCGKKGAFDWTGAVSPYSTLSKTSGTLAAAQEQALTVNLKPSQMGVGNRVVTVKFSSGTMEAVTLINVSVKSAPPADGGTTDAGKDAGVADAGLDSGFDAGFDAGLDGGKTDGGTDSGIQVDSGTVNDSGVMDDSGATDGALAVDSGYGSDSSFPADGSSPGDASQAQDGGSESDGDAPVAQAAGCSCSMLGF